ncbi:hypothetical protein NQ314_007182, partial [Rhamnusium bicolor]
STPQATVLKPATNIMLTSPHTIIPSRIQLPAQKLNMKLENGSTFQLPPTPPSCSSSEDSEDNVTISQPSSPAARKNTARMVLNHHTLTRQPINTPLISSQPISAQESRRKKKEYMDQLERKVEILVTENNDYRQKIESLEDSNSSLLSQLQKLQAIVARTHPQIMKQLKQNN